MKIDIPDSLRNEIYEEWFEEAKEIYTGGFLSSLHYLVGRFVLWLFFWTLMWIIILMVLS